MEQTNTVVTTVAPLTFSALKDAFPYVSGASPFNRTATSFANAKNNGNLNRSPKNYRAQDGKNVSGHLGGNRRSE